jgi:hypothetical protein
MLAVASHPWTEARDGDAVVVSFVGTDLPSRGCVVAQTLVVSVLGLAVLGMWAVVRAAEFNRRWGLTAPYAVVAAVMLLGAIVAYRWFVARRDGKPLLQWSKSRREVRFALRLGSSKLSLTGDDVLWTRAIALERIVGFTGDRRLHVEVRDGGSVMLPCGLPSGDHGELAAALNRILGDLRANEPYR